MVEDVDIAVAVRSDNEAEQLVHTLQQRGYNLVGVIEQTATGRLATARLSSPGESGVLVDLLFASSGIEPEIADRADPIEIADREEARLALGLIVSRGFNRGRDLTRLWADLVAA